MPLGGLRQHLLAQARNLFDYTYFLTGFRTGLRTGELIALKWSDLDLRPDRRTLASSERCLTMGPASIHRRRATAVIST